MAHKRLGYRFENDWEKERLEQRAIPHYRTVQTIPVNTEIQVDTHVLNLDKAKQILRKAHTISVMDCMCRAAQGHCDAPVNVCIDMNQVAERNLAQGTAREITFNEAVEILELTHRAGLVHMAMAHEDIYEPGVVNSICSCCSCCCTQLSGLLRYGLAAHVLKSDEIEVTDYDKCNLCGECVDRCQFGARSIIDNSLVVDHDLCFGCGLCVSICPTNAITLVDKQ